jgi:outer membrane protein OmpA-like peptidoglycan-associated protein
MAAPLRSTLVATFVVAISSVGAVAVARAAGVDTVTGAGIKVQVDKARVNLKEHRLEVKMWPRSSKISLVVVGESGATLAEEEQDFTGRPAGSPLLVTWTPSNSDEPVAKITIKAGDERGYIGLELLPWTVTIPHDDVNFRTASSDIDAAEVPKLDAAYTKLGEILAKDKDKKYRSITLFIAGHTDTVGDGASNLNLSRERARSIASWFRKRGTRIPIAYEGYGETALAVSTADGVDEPRNRRVDYILSMDEPTMKTNGFKPAWKRVK